MIVKEFIFWLNIIFLILNINKIDNKSFIIRKF